MDLAVASSRQDPLVPVVVAHDEQRSSLSPRTSMISPEWSGIPDRSTVDRDAVTDAGSHVDHLLALTIRRRRLRRQSGAARAPSAASSARPCRAVGFYS